MKHLRATSFSEKKKKNSFIGIRCIWNMYAVISNTSIWFSGYDSAGSVLISPVPHQMMSYMNVGTLSRTELQLLNQLHCRRKRRHRTIFTDEQLEALENLFQETKYPDVGTREQLARKVHLREEKVEVSEINWSITLNDSSRYFRFIKRWLKFLLKLIIFWSCL